MYDQAGRIQWRVRGSLIQGIRNAFLLHPKWPFLMTPDNNDFDYVNSKVFISDAIPNVSVAYPVIVVSTASSAEEDRFLGPDLVGDYVNQSISGLTVPGSFTLTLTSIPLTASIKIYTRDTGSRDDLISVIYDALKQNRVQLAVDGVEVIQTRWAPDGREYIFDRWWNTSTVELELFAEWSNKDVYSTIVSKVHLTNVFTDTSTQEFPN